MEVVIMHWFQTTSIEKKQYQQQNPPNNIVKKIEYSLDGSFDPNPWLQEGDFREQNRDTIYVDYFRYK